MLMMYIKNIFENFWNFFKDCFYVGVTNKQKPANYKKTWFTSS